MPAVVVMHYGGPALRITLTVHLIWIALADRERRPQAAVTDMAI
jgi:hypothetical protein